MSLQILREERGRIAVQMRDLAGKTEWDAATDKSAFDKMVDSLNSVDTRISAQIKSDEILSESAVTDAAAEAALRIAKDKKKPGLTQYARWLKAGDKAITDREWADIRNTMSTTTTTEGGYTVEVEVAKQVIDYMKAYGGMRSVANILATDGGNDIQFPTSDGTAETGEWIAQNTTATAADLVFGSTTLKTFKASSKIVPVPYELMQDSNVDVEALVNKRIGQRLGRLCNTGYTTGGGTAAPNGIVTAASVGVTAANATSQVTAIVYNSLLDLIHSIDPAYRMGGNCKWMMNDSSIKVVRKIVDSQSRPLFTPGYDTQIPGVAGSQPDSLMGYPIVLNQDVAAMGASAKSIIFGDFSYYTIRDVMGFTLFRFTDSAYTKLGQVAFLAWMRTGGQLLDINAVKLFVNAAS